MTLHKSTFKLKKKRQNYLFIFCLVLQCAYLILESMVPAVKTKHENFSCRLVNSNQLTKYALHSDKTLMYIFFSSQIVQLPCSSQRSQYVVSKF